MRGDAIMVKYNPSDFQLSGTAVIAAWAIAAICVVVLTVMLPISV
jgi:hypothetical protein